MLSSGWRGSISNFAIYLDVPIPADRHTKPGLNVACGLRSPLLGPFLFRAARRAAFPRTTHAGPNQPLAQAAWPSELISHRLAGFAAYKFNHQRGPSAVDSPSGVESMGARVLLLESA
jgi:hypothetical protein